MVFFENMGGRTQHTELVQYCGHVPALDFAREPTNINSLTQ